MLPCLHVCTCVAHNGDIYTSLLWCPSDENSLALGRCVKIKLSFLVLATQLLNYAIKTRRTVSKEVECMCNTDKNKLLILIA